MRTVFHKDMELYIDGDLYAVAYDACIRNVEDDSCIFCSRDVGCSSNLRTQYNTLKDMHERGEIHVTEE